MMTVRDEFLADMKGCRSILIADYSYFIHETEMAGLSRIREKGLEPKIVDERPEEVVARLGEDGRRIICFRPFGVSFVRHGSREKGLIELAISAEVFRSLVEAVQRRSVRVTVISTISSQPPMIADELRRQADVFTDLVELQSRLGRDPSERPASREPRHHAPQFLQRATTRAPRGEDDDLDD